jgi:hypothetical protein
MSACDMQTAEAILAKMVARAIAADYPELFPTAPRHEEGGGTDMSDTA